MNGLPPAVTALLDAPGRDRSPGAAECVGLAPDDSPELRAALEQCAARIVELERRGVWHGEWAEFNARGPRPAPGALRAAWRARFAAARPIVLPGLVDPGPAAALLAERDSLGERLWDPSGLPSFLAAAKAELAEGGFSVQSAPPRELRDERDLARVELALSETACDDLWVKSSRLSTFAGDRSVRLRLSFGREVLDDASRDVARHRAVSALAERLLPECRLAHGHPALRGLLDEWVGAPTFLTQHIAYWNAPGGGALFHHDAFDEPLVGGQRGVCYLQLTGVSAWLALSLTDLAAHVRGFMQDLAAGEAPWVRAALFPSAAAFERAERLARDPRRLRAELARPGCGAFAGLVNRGPEFTAALVDAGHAWLLDPGDVIVLPNHGLGETCMHSVFCASDEAGYALSMALRA